uniref:Uncharacterized protein n=1 Tax=Romanomermis culicivorax TaxID=13658 RepID=A0A915HM78_ROMCU
MVIKGKAPSNKAWLTLQRRSSLHTGHLLAPFGEETMWMLGKKPSVTLLLFNCRIVFSYRDYPNAALKTLGNR